MDKMPYSELAPLLKTGDLVLFSGRYQMSKIVEKLEGSKWSHVAMVLRLDGYDEPLLYEATALTNLPNLINGQTVTGPKVVNLKKRLETYGSDVTPYVPPMYSVRRSNHEATSDEVTMIKSIVTNLEGLPNPGTWPMIFEVILGRYLYIPTPMTNITCSGFIAYTFRKLGWLKGHKPINGFMPKDFSTDGTLTFSDHITYSDEILIDLQH